MSFLNSQINSVKDQQKHIIAKLNAEYQDTEQQIIDLGIEVCLLLTVLVALVVSQ